MSQIDFEKDQEEVLTRTKEIKSLSDEVLKLRSLEDEMKRDEEALKEKQKEIDRISQDVIPTMLSEMGLSSLKLADGSSVDVKPFYSASISVKNREAAYKWLRDQGLGDIIKNNVFVTFGKGEDDKAKQLLDLAAENGFEPQQKSDVAWATLTALFRERIESGLDMPSDVFSTWIKDKTKITRK